MTKESSILGIAVELERLFGVTPTDGLRLEISDEAKLKRIHDALVSVDSIGNATPIALADLTDVLDALAPVSDDFLQYNGTSWGTGTVSAPPGPRNLHVEAPDDGEDVSFFKTDVAITLSELNVVVVGDTSPSVTWTMLHDTSRSASGTTIKVGTATNETVGDTFTTFADATVPADSFIWLETSGQSGNVDEMSVTMFYTEDS